MKTEVFTEDAENAENASVSDSVIATVCCCWGGGCFRSRSMGIDKGSEALIDFGIWYLPREAPEDHPVNSVYDKDVPLGVDLGWRS